MSEICVLGIDPGMANCGYAEMLLRPHSEQVLSMGVISTKKSNVKKGVLATDDNFERLKHISKTFRKIIEDRGTIKAICAESMSYPPNASAAAKMAMVWGVICTLSVIYDLPVIQASPQQIKRAVCGNNEASKEDVEAALIQKYDPNPAFLAGVARSKREHPFDALGSIVSCFDSAVILMARKMAT